MSLIKHLQTIVETKNNQLSAATISTINQVWGQIASDSIEVVGDDPELAAEMCIDSDRLTTFGEEGGPAAQKEVRELIKKVGYEQTLKIIAKECDVN